MRARIGSIIPSSDRLTEPHMRYSRLSVEAHTRLRMTVQNHLAFADLTPKIVDHDARAD